MTVPMHSVQGLMSSKREVFLYGHHRPMVKLLRAVLQISYTLLRVVLRTLDLLEGNILP